MASERVVWVPCFNRPAYLASCLRSLAANPEIAGGEIDVFLFADGGDSQQDDCIATAKRARIPAITIVKRGTALGCGLNLIEAREELYALGYQQWLLVEEDMVVTPQYVRLMSRLWNWAKRSWRNVGAVCSNAACRLDRAGKRRHVAMVEPCNYIWNSYLLDRGTWESIRPLMLEYRDRFLAGRTYRERPHDAIREWAVERVRQRPPGQAGDVPIIPGAWNGEPIRAGERFPTGQDAATSVAFLASGLVKLGLVVNRTRTIGEIGMHSQPARFRQRGLHRVRLDAFAADAERADFKLAERAYEQPPPTPAVSALRAERLWAPARSYWRAAWRLAAKLVRPRRDAR